MSAWPWSTPEMREATDRADCSRCGVPAGQPCQRLDGGKPYGRFAHAPRCQEVHPR